MAKSGDDKEREAVHEILFVSKKIVLRLLFPVCIALMFGIAGLVFRRRRWSGCLIALGFAWLLVFSFPVTGLELIHSIESKAGTYADPERLAEKGVKYVVVLSGGYRNGDLSIADRLGESVLRLIEGIRLWRALPDARLVLTGGKTPGLSSDGSIARGLRSLAVKMGVPSEAIILEERSWTTEDQAKMTAAIVGKEPFALVTSAFHIPRSMLLFRLAGLRPIPAPCDFRAKRYYYNYETLIPQARGLVLSQLATKEYLATWWYQIKAGLSARASD